MTSKHRPFDDVRHSLGGVGVGEVDQASVRLDRTRVNRAGVPEVVYAERKSAEVVIEGLRGLVEANGRALASRCPVSTIAFIERELSDDFEIEVNHEARAV